MNALINFDRLFRSPFADLDIWKQFDSDMVKQDNNFSVYEKNGECHIELPFPGLSEENIRVKIDKEKRLLTVSGEAKEEKNEESDKITWHRKAHVNRKYSFYIDEKFALDSVSAHFEQGMLKVKLKAIDPQVIEKQNILEIPVQKV